MPFRRFDGTTQELVRTVRERRFARGLACPRCGSDAVIRWGQFAGRQRYRCRSCHRCSSDLTGTSFSYIKRLAAWPAYCRCLSASQSVRSSAMSAGVSVSTAFRWRHRILQAARDLDATQLSGLVEFAETSFRYSTKGYKRGAAPRWEPDMYYGRVPVLARPGCVVVVAMDRQGGHIAERLDTRRLTGAQLQTLFDDVVAADATVLCNSGRYGPHGWLQRTSSGASRPLIRVPRFGGYDRNPYHNRNAHAWLRRFSDWLGRFRGVATRYLPSYLEWRRVLDLAEAGPWLVRLIPCPPPP